VCTRIGSREVTRLIFDDSYHMLTLDNERAAVAQAAVDFLSRQSAIADAEPFGSAERSRAGAVTA